MFLLVKRGTYLVVGNDVSVSSLMLEEQTTTGGHYAETS